MSDSLVQVKELIDEVTDYVDKLNYYPSIDTLRGIVIWALVSKSIVVGKATCALVEQGFHEEAFGLTRTLVDLMFTVRYITNKDTKVTEERAAKFADFMAKDVEAWMTHVSRFFPQHDLSDVPNREQLLEKAKAFKHPHNWTGRPDQTKMMAMVGDDWENDSSGNPLKCEFDYELMYKLTSHYVHPTVVALKSHAIERPGPFHVHANKERGDMYKDLALFNVAAYLNRILIHATRCLEQDFPSTLADRFLDICKTLK